MRKQNFKIAIHSRNGSFSDRWIEYCGLGNIPFGMVDCNESDIMLQLASFDALLWHWDHNDVRASLFARQLIRSLEQMGMSVFPDTSTCWHYDDKVGQKYLLESINAPLVPCYVFYDREKAIDWIHRADFPKVFKLRGGAGSSNVRLIRDRSTALKICKKAFGKGFVKYPGYFADFQTKMDQVRQKGNYLEKVLRIPSTMGNIARRNWMSSMEKGYVYFQEFVPDNDHDTRITVIGKRAFAFRRMVRKNDFRASGSGVINHDPSKVDLECVRIAFETAGKLRSQSMAFDFVRGSNSDPQIVEISYCYSAPAVYDCPGHWDSDLNWNEGNMWPQDAILEDLLAKIAP